ncbi:unnamed protein product [Gongylonema pulchrum]|uniref:FERM domain-containing protein n=1 Tax=Gongylonema pulchrum TaxID=637853 RepID=A0A183D078_9BILA|nr:unnamed protein product [Gongylonema pulchrum]
MGLEMHEFNIMKHYTVNEDDGYECVTCDTETIRAALQVVQRLSVKLRAPLKENEKLVHVVRFERDIDDIDKWPTLLNVPVAAKTQVRTVLTRCQEQLKNVYEYQYDLRHLRLRDYVLAGGMQLLDMDITLEQRERLWHDDLYLQILTGKAFFFQHSAPPLFFCLKFTASELSVQHFSLARCNSKNMISIFTYLCFLSADT